jgi:putative tryptophan/tyrosine transport system substrate-binding protein
MRRREFIAGLGGAMTWPKIALGQQSEQVRRIGVLSAFNEDDPEAKAYLSEFVRALQELGWSVGRNLRMDVRWAGDNVDQMRTFAKELVDLQPDVILAYATPATAALQRETRTIPIVFVGVSDPVGAGFVASLSHPGANLTGFIFTEAGMAGKWLELLLELAPGIKRVAIMFNPDTAVGGGSYFLTAFEAAARSFKVAPIAAAVHSDAEIETIMGSLGREPGGGLVITSDAVTRSHRAPIILLAAQNHGTGGLSAIFVCPRRRPAFIWTRQSRPLSSRGPLCRSHSSWDQAGGASRSTANQIRYDFERQDRQDPRPNGAAVDTAERRRGDRVGDRRLPRRVLCHEHHRSTRRCATVREMEEGPSRSAIRC